MPKGKILIVDDDPDIALATRLSLEAVGYEVVEARSSSEGLAQVKACHPDLIILDIMMETTTAGFQMALKLRSSEPTSEYAVYRDIPIIMVTSVHSTTPVRFGPDEDYLPIEEFLDKPVDPDVLITKIARLLTDGE